MRFIHYTVLSAFLSLVLFAPLSQEVFAQQKGEAKKIEQEKEAKEAKRKAKKEAKEAKRKAKKEAKEAKRKAKKEAKEGKKKDTSPQTSTKEKKEAEGVGITGIPLISYSDDLGFTYGVRLILTDYRSGYNPYRYQVWGQFQLSTAGFQDHAAKADLLLRNGLRFRTRVGFSKELLADYYGFGNNQDIRRIRAILRGDAVTGVNLLSEGETDSLTKKELEESQNRYYNYEYSRPYMDASMEGWLPDKKYRWLGNVKLYMGFLLQYYTIHSYFGETGDKERIPDTRTFVDIDQPLGYDTIQENRPAFVNLLRFAAAYDTRPRERESNPNKGIFTDFHYEYSGVATGSRYEFHNFTLTYRQYFDIFPSFFNKHNMELVFAYRLLARQTVGHAPFFQAGTIRNITEEINGLGGSKGLRGYPSNQFIDRFITLGNFEFRYTYVKTRWLGGMDFQFIVFYDAGRVSDTVETYFEPDEITAYHHAGGPAVTLVWQRNTIIIVQYGKSQFHSFFAFTLSHSF